MKRNYVVLMAMLLFAVVGFTGCSDDDEGGISGNAEELLIGRWLGIWSEGYDIYVDGKKEWNESIASEGFYYTFNDDGTVEINGYPTHWEVSGNLLNIEGENYIITTLNENTLVLEYRESYEGGDYYEKNTFERVN